MSVIRSIRRNISRNQSRDNYYASHGTMLGYKAHCRRLRVEAHKKLINPDSSKFQSFKDKAKSVFTSKFNLRKSQNRGKK